MIIYIGCPQFLLFSLCLFTYFVNINVYFDFARNIVVAVLFLYVLLIVVYIYMFIHPVAHLTMPTFVQKHLLYLIAYHMKITCSNTDIDLTNCSLCLFTIREPGIA